MTEELTVFQDKNVRRIWYNDEWHFSIIDIIAILIDNDFQGARNYWKVLKHRLKEEGNETVTNCNQLKMIAEDGKLRNTDVADIKQLFRLIQSIPSPKAEPFKQWLAQVGKDKIDEMEDPELAIDKAMQYYLQKGYSKDWINQRLKTIEVRKQLTDEWNRVGITEKNKYAILTNEITKAWSGKSIKEYKQLKNLKKENLRDNMTNIELILNMLAEATTKEISEKETPENFEQSIGIAQEGGNVAKVAKDRIEKRLNQSIISSKNAKEIHFNKKKVMN